MLFLKEIVFLKKLKYFCLQLSNAKYPTNFPLNPPFLPQLLTLRTTLQNSDEVKNAIS